MSGFQKHPYRSLSFCKKHLSAFNGKKSPPEALLDGVMKDNDCGSLI